MLQPVALLVLSALAARADVDGGADALAAALRADLRRDNDDYGAAGRRSALLDPVDTFVPKSKYIRPIQNNFAYPGLNRRTLQLNKTNEKEAGGKGKREEIRENGRGERRELGGERVDEREGGNLGEAKKSVEDIDVKIGGQLGEEAVITGGGGMLREIGGEIRGEGGAIREEGGVIKRGRGNIKGEAEEIRGEREDIKGRGGEKTGRGEEERSLGKKIENNQDTFVVSAEGETTSRIEPRITPRTPSRTTSRSRLTSGAVWPSATAAPASRPAPHSTLRARDVASVAKKRYEILTRTPADPQQIFKNENESVEKFNSLSSTRAPDTVVTVMRSLPTPRKTLMQIVTSVREMGATAMRAVDDTTTVTASSPSSARTTRVARGGQVRDRGRPRAKGRARARPAPPALRKAPSGEPERPRPRPRTHRFHADPELKQLRAGLRAGYIARMPPAHLLDMSRARGPRVNVRRMKNRLCDRQFLRPEGPKYDRRGNIYLEKFVPRGRGNYGFDQTRPPHLVLPRCCNCCRKSVLGCE